MTLLRVLAVLAAPAWLAACSSVNIGVGLPIGRVGSIFIGGSVPLPPPTVPAPAASAASASAPKVPAPAPGP